MSFYTSNTVKAARKAFRCDECGQKIVVGQPRLDAAYMSDGMFCTSRAHPDCDAYVQAAFKGEEERPFLIDCDWIREVVQDFPPPAAVRERLLMSAPWIAKYLGAASSTSGETGAVGEQVTSPNPSNPHPGGVDV